MYQLCLPVRSYLRWFWLHSAPWECLKGPPNFTKTENKYRKYKWTLRKLKLNSVDIIISLYTTVVTIPTATCDSENISLENSSVWTIWISQYSLCTYPATVGPSDREHCVLCEVQIECNADSISFGRSKPRANSCILLTPRSHQPCRKSGNRALLEISTS